MAAAEIISQFVRSQCPVLSFPYTHWSPLSGLTPLKKAGFHGWLACEPTLPSLTETKSVRTPVKISRPKKLTAARSWL
jgi:hypothetical protein